MTSSNAKRTILLRYSPTPALAAGCAMILLALLVGFAFWVRIAVMMTEYPRYIVLFVACLITAMLCLGGAVIHRVTIGDRAALWLDRGRLRAVFWSVKLDAIDSIDLKTKQISYSSTEVLEILLRDGTSRNLSVSTIEPVSPQKLVELRALLGQK